MRQFWVNFFMKKMKYISAKEQGTSEDFFLLETDIPEIGPNDVLIKIHFSGVNRPDILQRDGKYLPPVDASDTAGEKVGKAIGRFFLGPLIPGDKIGHIERNINITFDPIKESLVEIRVAFQMYEITKELNTLFSNNETIESDLTDQPEVYQAFFEEIDKELFVRKNKY